MNKRSNIFLSLGISVALIALAIMFLGHWGYGRWSGSGSWWPMHNGYYGSGGMMGFGGMGVVSWLFWGALILAIVFFIASRASRGRPENSVTNSSDSSLEILKQRYARGEIDKEQFIAQKNTLEK